jgi:hypothetical protein
MSQGISPVPGPDLAPGVRSPRRICNVMYTFLWHVHQIITSSSYEWHCLVSSSELKSNHRRA